MTCCAGGRASWPPRARSCPRRRCRNGAGTRPARPRSGHARPPGGSGEPASCRGSRPLGAGGSGRPPRPRSRPARRPRRRPREAPHKLGLRPRPGPAGHPALPARTSGDPRHVPALRGLGADGKASRGAKVKGQEAPQHLGFFLHSSRLNAAQRGVDRKTNEATVIGPVIDEMDLAGVCLTVDAPHSLAGLGRAGAGPRRPRHLRDQGEPAPHLPGPGRHRLGAGPGLGGHLRG